VGGGVFDSTHRLLGIAETEGRREEEGAVKKEVLRETFKNRVRGKGKRPSRKLQGKPPGQDVSNLRGDGEKSSWRLVKGKAKGDT